jgi:single-stranded-DNA-specific exonuclease
MQWKRHTTRERSASHYARECGIHELTAQCLLNRGINGIERIESFLHGTIEQVDDPFLMRNMDAAVRRIRRALTRRERIHIHGDYDVDGVSSTAVLMLGLRAVGADVHYHIVNRNDSSVGLGVQSLHRDHLPHKPALIITADCGTSNLAAIEQAAAHGVDVIVVDHHVPGPRLPKCAALLNPMQPRCEYPFKQFAAVGVAYNLIVALDRFLQRDGGEWPEIQHHQLLDLVALGTISDLVPLVGPNRVYAREGLELLKGARRPGICALMRSARLLRGGSDTVNARTVGFRLAPLLNAAGRMDDANKCVELLITDSYRSADSVSRELQEANLLRQQCEREVLQHALTIAEALVADDAPVVVLAERTWHPGVLGIVASRLVERYHRPCVVTSVTEDGTAKGSIRSPDGIDMLDALHQCRDLLDTYGGHKVAAGVAFPVVGLDDLRRRLGVAVRSQLPNGNLLERSVHVDATVDFEQLDRSQVRELETLSPFGASNPEPVFEAQGVHVLQMRQLHGGHVRLRLKQGNRTLEAYGYGMGKRVAELRRGGRFLFTPRIVGAPEDESVELVLRDFAGDGDP